MMKNDTYSRRPVHRIEADDGINYMEKSLIVNNNSSKHSMQTMKPSKPLVVNENAYPVYRSNMPNNNDNLHRVPTTTHTNNISSNEVKKEYLHSRSLNVTKRNEEGQEEKSSMGTSINHVNIDSQHRGVQSRYLSVIRSKSDECIEGMNKEITYPVNHTVHKTSTPSNELPNKPSNNKSAIELKREYLMSRSLSKSHDGDEAGGGGKSTISASTRTNSDKHSVQSAYLSALKPTPHHKSAIELKREYLMSRSLSKSHDGDEVGTSHEEKSPLSASSYVNHKKNNVQSIYLSALKSNSDSIKVMSGTVYGPIGSVQPCISDDQEGGHEESPSKTSIQSRRVYPNDYAMKMTMADSEHANTRQLIGSVTKANTGVKTNAAVTSSAAISVSNQTNKVLHVIADAGVKESLSPNRTTILKRGQQNLPPSGHGTTYPSHRTTYPSNGASYPSHGPIKEGSAIPTAYSSKGGIVKEPIAISVSVATNNGFEQASYPCHSDILSALESEIRTLMRCEGWSRETAVRILLAKNSGSKNEAPSIEPSHQPLVNAVTPPQSSSKMIPYDHQSAIKKTTPQPQKAISNHQSPLNHGANERRSDVRALQPFNSNGSIMQPHRTQGNQIHHQPIQGNSQHPLNHHQPVIERTTPHTNRVFDHQPAIKQLQSPSPYKATANYPVVTAKQSYNNKESYNHRQNTPSSAPIVFNQYSPGKGPNHHYNSYPRTTVPDDVPDWCSLSTLSLSGSEYEDGTMVCYDCYL